MEKIILMYLLACDFCNASCFDFCRECRLVKVDAKEIDKSQVRVGRVSRSSWKSDRLAISLHQRTESQLSSLNNSVCRGCTEEDTKPGWIEQRLR